MVKIKLEMTLEQAKYLSRACELVARFGMGQFKDMFETINDKLSWDDLVPLENLVKEKLYPGLSPQSYHAMHSNKCPEECRIAWDAYQYIRREIAWNSKGMDWRKDERICGEMMQVNYDDPMNTAKHTGFKTELLKE